MMTNVEALQLVILETKLAALEIKLATEKEIVDTYRVVLGAIAANLADALDDPTASFQAIATIVAAGEEFDKNIRRAPC
jgi:hypothetical protein